MSKPWRGVDLGQLVAAGKTSPEIADISGASCLAVRAALRRRGLKPNPAELVNVRRIAEDMPPRDAVEYLLGILGDVMPALTGDDCDFDHWGVDWTPSRRLILGVLHAASPHPVSADKIWSLICDASDGSEDPDRSVVVVHISKIRKQLPPEHGQIVTYWGRGYAFEPADQGVAGTPPTAAQEGATGHA
ncbi:helix-turn-helix domain-containing protein [Phaeobacter sp. A90-2a-3-a]|uniref:helix-turn-helix domain-containing protein n=1 Tax=unclassified Phaeobacter TaxID=2621772 RepID=UPI003A8BF23A